MVLDFDMLKNCVSNLESTLVPSPTNGTHSASNLHNCLSGWWYHKMDHYVTAAEQNPFDSHISLVEPYVSIWRANLVRRSDDVL